MKLAGKMLAGLNDQYKKYQQLPLWGPGSEKPYGGHKIVKVLVYLQSHEKDDRGLLIVPGSYRNPSLEQTRVPLFVQPKKGSIVIFEQRSTHRGMTIMQGLGTFLERRDQERILVSLGYGLNNNHTNEFEAGTRARQLSQCGKYCSQRGTTGVLTKR